MAVNYSELIKQNTPDECPFNPKDDDKLEYFFISKSQIISISNKHISNMQSLPAITDWTPNELTDYILYCKTIKMIEKSYDDKTNYIQQIQEHMHSIRSFKTKSQINYATTTLITCLK